MWLGRTFYKGDTWAKITGLEDERDWIRTERCSTRLRPPRQTLKRPVPDLGSTQCSHGNTGWMRMWGSQPLSGWVRLGGGFGVTSPSYKTPSEQVHGGHRGHRGQRTPIASWQKIGWETRNSLNSFSKLHFTADLIQEQRLQHWSWVHMALSFSDSSLFSHHCGDKVFPSSNVCLLQSSVSSLLPRSKRESLRRGLSMSVLHACASLWWLDPSSFPQILWFLLLFFSQLFLAPFAASPHPSFLYSHHITSSFSFILNPSGEEALGVRKKG